LTVERGVESRDRVRKTGFGRCERLLCRAVVIRLHRCARFLHAAIGFGDRRASVRNRAMRDLVPFRGTQTTLCLREEGLDFDRRAFDFAAEPRP
jgi:hypothetical protein